MSDVTDQSIAELLPDAGAMFGPFRVNEQIGRGGFARIYRATLPDGQVCALKILTPEMPPPSLYSDELFARFEREALVLQGVETPYAVRMYDYGRASNGLLYMVFEHLDGETVAEMLEAGPLDVAVVMQAFPQLLRALDAVHSAGLLHRDLKPSNIMICRTPMHPHHVKLIDFGIAKAFDKPVADEQILDLTAHGEAIGTPRYMAPERILGRPAGPSSDLYSLACTLSEMLTGERLVQGDDPVEVVRKHLSAQELELPAELGVPEVVVVALRKMLQKNPNERPQSAAAILEELSADPRFAPPAAELPVNRPAPRSALRVLAVVLAAALTFTTFVWLPWWAALLPAVALLVTVVRL